MLKCTHIVPAVVAEFEQSGELRGIDIFNRAVYSNVVDLVTLPFLKQEINSKAGPVGKQSSLNARYFDVRITTR